MKSISVTQAAVAVATALGLAIMACSGDDSSATGPSCAAGELLCGTSCVEPMTDPANCGGCGTACAGAELCSQGTCSLTCSPGTTQCTSSCVDVNVDPKNCGACGKVCDPGNLCKGGACVAQCPSSAQTICIGDGGAASCVTTTTDSANCGGCGNVCAPGKVCSGGNCGDTCGAGETLCPGGGDAGAAYCARTQSDQANCGACGKPCATGLVCSGGMCVAQCTPGLTLCGSECVDTMSDPDNCGGCGKAVCSGSTSNCAAGVCVSVIYATAKLTGTKDIAFVYAGSGTAIGSDAAYASFCTAHGFTQNQNSSSAAVYTSASMSNSTNYYCTQYCCYLGSGNSMHTSLSSFQNHGLPTSTPLQVLDRGCGDYSGSYLLGLETSDTLTVTGSTTFTYTPNGLGPYNYGMSKTLAFSQAGVVVCEMN